MNQNNINNVQHTNYNHTYIGLILFKLACEILYKIVKACEIIIQNHDRKNN